jgi:hypothetical protein
VVGALRSADVRDGALYVKLADVAAFAATTTTIAVATAATMSLPSRL